jgi:hypothetical protein
VSSKRVFGALALTLGVIGKIALFILCVIPGAAPADASTANGIADGLLLTGAGLLGITALDVFKRGA